MNAMVYDNVMNKLRLHNKGIFRWHFVNKKIGNSANFYTLKIPLLLYVNNVGILLWILEKISNLYIALWAIHLESKNIGRFLGFFDDFSNWSAQIWIWKSSLNAIWYAIMMIFQIGIHPLQFEKFQKSTYIFWFEMDGP